MNTTHLGLATGSAKGSPRGKGLESLSISLFSLSLHTYIHRGLETRERPPAKVAKVAKGSRVRAGAGARRTTLQRPALPGRAAGPHGGGQFFEASLNDRRSPSTHMSGSPAKPKFGRQLSAPRGASIARPGNLPDLSATDRAASLNGVRSARHLVGTSPDSTVSA